MNKQQLIAAFADKFAGATGTLYASLGRINLIGEHTDYNGGFVFPGAVEQCIMSVIRPNNTDTVRAYSLDLNEYGEWQASHANSSNEAYLYADSIPSFPVTSLSERVCHLPQHSRVASPSL